MKNKQKSQIVKIILTFIIMLILLYMFKWYPMSVYGKDILYDASAHIVFASFILYILYFFINKNKSWRIPFFIFSFVVLIVISFQRIYINAHNDIGILLGFLIALISIAIPNYNLLILNPSKP